MEPLLEVRGLGVLYLSPDGKRHKAVEQVSFQIQPGQVLGVLGESGCGKSTTALSLLGLLPPGGKIERGGVFFHGQDLLQLPEKDLQKIRGAQISMIFQEPAVALNPVLRVGEQIADVIRAHSDGSRKHCRRVAEEMLVEVGFREVERIFAAYPHQLSGGQRQRVAIAQALACRPEVVIADEPTSSLDAGSQAEILSLLKSLQQRFGIACLLISHRPAVLAKLADRVIVMHAGRVVEEGSAEQVLQEPAHPYTRTLLNCRADEAVPACAPANLTHGGDSEPLLCVRGLQKSYVQSAGLFGKRFTVPALRGVDLRMARGGTLVLVGESGSGKSTLAKCIAGLESFDAGEVWLEGQNLGNLDTRALARLRPQVQLVFQNAAAALNPQLTAAEIIAEPLLIQRMGTPRERQALALELMEQVELPPDCAERQPLEFSGGQRQRLAIARALTLRPRLLILDEALSGLDLLTQLQMLQLLQKLQAEHHLAYLYITHDLSLAKNLANQIAVMSEGRIVEFGSTQELFANPRHPETRALLAFLPGPVPAAVGAHG